MNGRSKDEERAAVRAAARRHRADAQVLGMRATVARDEARGTWARLQFMLKLASESVDAALASLDHDVEAAKDDLIAARSLLDAAVLSVAQPVERRR